MADPREPLPPVMRMEDFGLIDVVDMTLKEFERWYSGTIKEVLCLTK